MNFPQFTCYEEVKAVVNYVSMTVSTDNYVFVEIRYYQDGRVEVKDCID